MRLTDLIAAIVSIANRLRPGARRREAEAVAEEMRFHRALLERDLAHTGVEAGEAHRLAAVRFGNLGALADDAADAWRFGPLESLGSDIRFAWRQWRRHPALLGIALGSIAIGVAANVGMFALLNATVLRPLDVPVPSGLRVVTSVGDAVGSTFLPWPLVERLRATSRGAMDVAGASAVNWLSIDTGDGPEGVREGGALVSGNYFEALGVAPALGRVLHAGDEDEGPGDHVVVVSDAFWRVRLGADPAAVGRVVRFNGVPCTIVGVAPAGFTGTQAGQAPAAWFPITADDALLHRPTAFRTEPTNWWVQVIGRVSPGADESALTQRLTTTLRDFRLALEGPQADSATRAGIARERLALEDGSTGFGLLRTRYERPLRLVWALAALVLVIACANVGSLLLGRVAARGREFAVRASLGASRGRLSRLVLVEGLALSAMGLVLGLALLRAGGGPVRQWLFPAGRRLMLTIGPDVRVVAITGLSLTVAVLALAVLPAWRVARGGAASLGVRGDVTAHDLRSGRALGVLQFALALPLVSCALLLGRSLERLADVPLGFAGDDVAVVRLDATRNDRQGEALVATYRRAAEAVRAVAGVRAVSGVMYTPLSGSRSGNTFRADGPVTEPLRTQVMYVDPGYFVTMGTPIVAGREFAEADAPRARGVVVLGEGLARRLFGTPSAAVGRRLARGSDPAAPLDLEVVGVAADARVNAPREPSSDLVYQPYLADAGNVRAYTLLVALPGATSVAASRIRRAIAQAEPRLEVLDVRPFAEQRAAQLVVERMVARLTQAFGLVAVLLATLGVYGVVAWDVTRRRPEIGVRLALGARPAQIGAWVLRGAARLVGVGVALGVPLAAIATRSARVLLYESAATEPMVLGGIAAVLAVAFALATWGPARRAANADPLRSIRAD